MKIYTKTGDAGQTGLFGGARVPKDAPRVAAYGDVDELNSMLGLALAQGDGDARQTDWLTQIQSTLFSLGAELACVPDKDVDVGVPLVTDADVDRLEGHIDALEVDLPALKNFVLPGGTAGAACLHAARTVCRRAERKLVALAADEPVRAQLLRYLNRLSDLLFVMARHANFRANLADVEWRARAR
jgi:cob(I)alamin adenosyltransferase